MTFKPNPLYQQGDVATNTHGFSINDVSPLFDQHRNEALRRNLPAEPEELAEEPVEEAPEEGVEEAPSEDEVEEEKAQTAPETAWQTAPEDTAPQDEEGSEKKSKPRASKKTTSTE